jgi:outer membrane receptor for ferrienterochelin and colicins
MNRWCGSRLSGVFLAFLCCLPARLPADEASQARFHFEQATRAYERGRWEEAVREFFAVHRLSKSGRTLFNIAVCFDRLEQPDKAFYYYAQYLRESGDSGEQAQGARRAIEQLRRRVGVLTLVSEPPGAEIYVDRREHGSYGTTPASVPVGPGRHAVWLERPGYRPVELTLEVGLGAERTESAILTPIVGKLVVSSEPPGEVLVLDAEGLTAARGVSPFEASLAPGAYVVEVSAQGHRTKKDLLRITADARLDHTTRLEALPPSTGVLTVTSNQRGAVIEVDGKAVGFAPSVLSSLPAGARQVRVSAPGTEPWSGPIDVKADGRGIVTVSLEPPPTTRRSLATWIVGGMGGAALLMSSVTGILMLDARDEYASLRAAPDGTSARPAYDRASALGQATDGLLISGAVALGVATFLYFATEEEDPRRSNAILSWE